jgi:choline dehydrogenase-like flavoprotein
LSRRRNTIGSLDYIIVGAGSAGCVLANRLTSATASSSPAPTSTGRTNPSGQPEDFDGWGVPGWRFDDLLPYFKKSENQSRGADAWHGVGGPLEVSDLPDRHELCDAFIDGLKLVRRIVNTPPLRTARWWTNICASRASQAGESSMPPSCPPCLPATSTPR